MDRKTFIDAAILVLAHAAPEGTPWPEVVQQARALADARDGRESPLPHAPFADAGTPRRGPPVKGNAEVVRAWLLGALDAAGGALPGGLAEHSSASPYGRDRTRAVITLLVSEGVVHFEQRGGRRHLVRTVQGDRA